MLPLAAILVLAPQTQGPATQGPTTSPPVVAPQSLTPPPKPAGDTVLAIVDGAPITAAEAEPYLWAWKARDTLNDLVVLKIVDAEAARKNLTVSDAEVRARMDQQLAAIKTQLQPGQTVESAVAAQPGGMSRLALSVHIFVLLNKIADSEFQPTQFVKVAAISFPTGAGTTDALSKAIKGADAAYAKLLAGRPWDDVAKANAAVAQSGVMGWRAVEIFPENVRAGLAATKPMGYTKPTQVGNGIQIFRLLARGQDAPPTEIAELKGQYTNSALPNILKRLRDKAKVEIK